MGIKEGILFHYLRKPVEQGICNVLLTRLENSIAPGRWLTDSASPNQELLSNQDLDVFFFLCCVCSDKCFDSQSATVCLSAQAEQTPTSKTS